MIQNTPGVSELLELLTDSKRGYQAAAERIGTVDAKELLQEFSAQRGPWIEGLQQLLHRSGEEIPGADTVKEDPDSEWLELRHALSQAPKEDLLQQCERSETFLADRYDDALEDAALPEADKEILRSQCMHVRNNLMRIAAMDHRGYSGTGNQDR